MVSFSGDKLLGGPQAGIILGKAGWIAAMKKNPLTRALRIDKLTLAALEATLRIYQEPEQVAKQIPTYQMLSMGLPELKARGRRLLRRLNQVPGLHGTLAEEQGQVGGGSVPTQMIPTWAVAVQHRDRLGGRNGKKAALLPHPRHRPGLKGPAAAGYAHHTTRIF